ncbi:MAG: hypothetical protein ACRENJ_00660 [Candidatus Eiseniibacteriota bacterium]
MSYRLRHPILIAMVSAPLALAAEPAVAAPKGAASKPEAARPVDERARLERLTDLVAASYDTARGGFVDKGGMPSEGAVELGLLLGRDAAGAAWKHRALATLDWTRTLMDTMSGGFVTRRPKSAAEGAAFETRTDVNGRRLSLLLAAWRATGDERYRRDAGRVAGFMDRVLLDGRGGFVAAQVGDRVLVPAPNGVAIHAWLDWAAANVNPVLRDFALRSIERVWETCFDPLGVLLRRGDFGEVLDWPRLADQVEMGRALVLSWRLCGRQKDLDRARGLGRVLIEKFEDRANGGFMTRARPKKDGTIRKAGREAAENARAALFLAELAAATGDRDFHEAGRRALAAFDEAQRKDGLRAADWALAQRALLEPEAPEAPAWRAAAEQRATPRVIFRARGVRR